MPRRTACAYADHVLNDAEDSEDDAWPRCRAGSARRRALAAVRRRPVSRTSPLPNAARFCSSPSTVFGFAVRPQAPSTYGRRPRGVAGSPSSSHRSSVRTRSQGRSRYRRRMPTPAVELEVGDAHRADHQPRPGLLLRARRDQARPRATTTCRSATGIVRALRERPCMLHRYPEGVDGEKIYQKRLPKGAPGLGRDRPRCSFPSGRTADELCVTELGQRRLGGADVDRRVPPVALPARRHRAPGRAAHRPRPAARHRLRRGQAGRRGRCTRCSTSSARSAGRRRPGRRACTSTCGSSRGTASARCAGPRWRSPARWSGGCPTLVTTAWWKEERGAAGLPRLQPERARTARSPRRTRCAASRGGRCRRR